MTQRLPVTIEKWSLWLFPVTATLLIPIAIWGVFFWVPTDAGLGLSQRIFYFHVPCAMASFASYAAAGLCGIAYLRSSASEWDHASNAAVGTGMLFGSLVLITGSIWARTAWGTWWTWHLTPTLSHQGRGERGISMSILWIQAFIFNSSAYMV